MAKIIAFNKPFGVICQFSGEGDTLANYINIPSIYAAGRLDKDSEGLVILTDDGKLQNKITNPKNNKSKIYVVQVEGEITQQAINNLRAGVELKDGLTKPASIKKYKSQSGSGIELLQFEKGNSSQLPGLKSLSPKEGIDRSAE